MAPQNKQNKSLNILGPYNKFIVEALELIRTDEQYSWTIIHGQEKSFWGDTIHDSLKNWQSLLSQMNR